MAKNNDTGKLLAAIASTAVIGIAGTWAYFISAQSAQNSFTIGNNTIEVTEEFEPPEELLEGDNVFKKKVQVENTGTVPCYVRVFYDFSDRGILECSYISQDEPDISSGSSGEEWPGEEGEEEEGEVGETEAGEEVGGAEEGGDEAVEGSEGGDNWEETGGETDLTAWIPAVEYLENLPEGWEYIPSGNSGLLGGYCYYTEPVLPGDSTGALFGGVKTVFGPYEDIKDYDIFVYAESVQALDKNGAPFTGADEWKQAWEEFLEPTGNGGVKN